MIIVILNTLGEWLPFLLPLLVPISKYLLKNREPESLEELLKSEDLRLKELNCRLLCSDGLPDTLSTKLAISTGIRWTFFWLIVFFAVVSFL